MQNEFAGTLSKVAIKNAIEMARGTMAGVEVIERVIEFIINREEYPNYEFDATIPAREKEIIRTLVEVVKTFNSLERFELLSLLIDYNNRRELSLSTELHDYLFEVCDGYGEILFTYDLTALLALRCSLFSPAKSVVFQATNESSARRIKTWAKFLKLEFFQTKVVDLDNNNLKASPEALEICIPPFGARLFRPHTEFNLPNLSRSTQMDEFSLLSYLGGRKHAAIFMVVDSLLFKGGLTTGTRAMLVESNRLTSVVALTAKQSFSKSSLTANLIFLKNATSPQVSHGIYLASERTSEKANFLAKPELSQQLFDASMDNVLDQNEGILVKKAVVETKDYDLTPDRYIETEASQKLDEFRNKYECTQLHNLVEIIRPVPIKDEGGEFEIKEIMISDFSNGAFVNVSEISEKIVRTNINNFVKIKSQMLRYGDILIGVKATIGKVAMVSDIDETKYFTANQNMLILRLSDKAPLSKEALLSFLSNKKVREYLDALATGSTLKNLKISYLKELEVPIPGEKIEHEIKSHLNKVGNINREIAHLKAELKKLDAEGWPAIDLK